MSGVPTYFDPLAIDKARFGGYISDGLTFLIDASREPVGELTSLKDWVSGESLPEQRGNAVISSGHSLSGHVGLYSVFSRDASKNRVVSVELCVDTRAVGSDNANVTVFPLVESYEWQTRLRYANGYSWGQGVLIPPEGVPSKRETTSGALRTPIRKDAIVTVYLTPNAEVVVDGAISPSSYYSAPNIGTFSGTPIFCINGTVKLCSLRLYNRELTTAEQLHNIAIDKIKFS